MALVQALPVPTDHPKSSLEVGQCRSVSHSPAAPPAPPPPPPSTGTMGSVSSLISSRGPSSSSSSSSYPERHCRTATTVASDFGAKCRKAAVGGTSCFRVQDGTLRSASSQEHLLSNHQHQQFQQQQQHQQALTLQLNGKKSATTITNNITNVTNAVTAGNGNYGFVGDDLLVGDWNDNLVSTCSPCSDSEETRETRALNGNIGGPPPKLIPVSGKLEKVRNKKGEEEEKDKCEEQGAHQQQTDPLCNKSVRLLSGLC